MKAFWKITNFFLFLLLIVAVSAVSGYVAMKVVLGGGELPVPSVMGKHIVEALEIMGQSDLTLEIRSQEFDPIVPKHSVTRQDPPAGHRVKRGRRIAVILSKGPREARVPELRGETWSRSVNILKAMGFKVGSVSWVESKFHQENSIIAQVPSPLIQVERGKGVNLLISKGKPRTAYVMPDLVGEDLNAALRVIRNSSLRVGKVVQTEYPGVLVNIILRTEPKAGYRISSGDSVRLFVAKGAEAEAKPTGTYAYFRYKLSEDAKESMVRVVLVHDRESREIFNGRKKGGQEVGLLVRLKGKTVARVYLEGKLTEERVLQ